MLWYFSFIFPQAGVSHTISILLNLRIHEVPSPLQTAPHLLLYTTPFTDHRSIVSLTLLSNNLCIHEAPSPLQTVPHLLLYTAPFTDHRSIVSPPSYQITYASMKCPALCKPSPISCSIPLHSLITRPVTSLYQITYAFMKCPVLCKPIPISCSIPLHSLNTGP